jgi:two-component system, chemotaxis family, protein-glutamate methylesterase/glutaminase
VSAPLVVMGASLGGFEAIRAVLRGLPSTYPCPIAVVQHRGDRADSADLVELWGRACALPVVEPDDSDPIEAGHVYVAPAGYHLLVDGAHFALSIDEPVLFARPSIDVLFESAAESLGPRVASVLLTSSSEDGALGSAAVWKQGGTTIIQDPATAERDVALRAALALHKPSHIAAVDDIPALLCTWCGLAREPIGEVG